MEKLLWNGNELEQAADWVGKALQQFDFDKPGYLIRMNKPTGNVIFVGTLEGEKVCHPGDFLVQEDDGTLNVINL